MVVDFSINMVKLYLFLTYDRAKTFYTKRETSVLTGINHVYTLL